MHSLKLRWPKSPSHQSRYRRYACLFAIFLFLPANLFPAPPQSGRVELKPGLNLVGLPVDPSVTPTLGDVLLHLGSSSELEKILRLDPENGLFQSCFYNTQGTPEGSACDATPNPGEGWLIYALTDHSITPDVDLDCPEFNLINGINIVTFPCVADGLTSPALLQRLGGNTKVSAVQTFDGTTDRFLSTSYFGNQTAGEDFLITQGRAYLVHMTEAVHISPPAANAGPDQTVEVGSNVPLQGSTTGNPINSIWSLVSKPNGSMAELLNASALNTSFVADKLGNYRVELSVSDQLSSSTDTVTITSRLSPVDALLNHQNPSTGLIHSLPFSTPMFNNHSFTYDNALVAMAFLSAEKIEAAEKILDAYLNLIPNANGGFLHLYSAADAADVLCGLLRTGHNAYLLQAMNLYYSKTGDNKYNTLAQQIATFILNRQDLQDGGIVAEVGRHYQDYRK